MQKLLPFFFSSLLFLSACSSQEADVKDGTEANSYYSDGEMVTPEAEPGTYEDLMLSVGDRVFFETNKADLNDEARVQAENWARWLTTYTDVKVTIEGHCDERGTREYNYALGEKRANAVKNYLLELGVEAHRIQVTSYGKDRPEVLGSGDEFFCTKSSCGDYFSISITALF